MRAAGEDGRQTAAVLLTACCQQPASTRAASQRPAARTPPDTTGGHRQESPMNAMPNVYEIARAANAAQPIVLYSFGPWQGLPSGSHFCLKTEIQLKLAGLAYIKDFTGQPQAPKGKLPYIRDGQEIVTDSRPEEHTSEPQ